MKTKPCIGYAPVVDGKIWGTCFGYTKKQVVYNVANSFGVIEIIKVEIRPVKKKTKPKKKGN